MIKALSKVFEFLGASFIPAWFPVTMVIWLILFLICYALGGVALSRIGRLGGFKKVWLAWLPGVQIYCEARFLDRPRTAKRIQHCLWWFFVAVFGCLASIVWLAVGISGVEGVSVDWMKGALIAFAVAALVLCFLIRADELSCFKKILGNGGLWWLSILGTVFCIPLQRIFLFSMVRAEEEEEEEDDEEDEEL